MPTTTIIPNGGVNQRPCSFSHLNRSSSFELLQKSMTLLLLLALEIVCLQFLSTMANFFPSVGSFLCLFARKNQSKAWERRRQHLLLACPSCLTIWPDTRFFRDRAPFYILIESPPNQHLGGRFTPSRCLTFKITIWEGGLHKTARRVQEATLKSKTIRGGETPRGLNSLCTPS